jgi:hypothetical protein
MPYLRRQLVGAPSQLRISSSFFFASKNETRASFDQAKTLSGECTEARYFLELYIYTFILLTQSGMDSIEVADSTLLVSRGDNQAKNSAVALVRVALTDLKSRF